jgi:hypothetical protein
MGMYDSVWADCPNCKSKRSIEFQSKASECQMNDFSIDRVPLEIAQDINTEESYCYSCSAQYAIIKVLEINTLPMKLVETRHGIKR